MKIVFMGTPQPAAVSLERLIAEGHEVVAVYTQPDRPAGRGNKIAFSPVKQLAIERGIPVFQPLKVRTQEAAELFASHDADAAVVVAYGRILPAAFLNAFKYGAINVHFSLLPKYRGAAPVNWAIVNGETVTGVTTMKMDEGLDTGDILLQESLSIGAAETAIELMSRLADLGAQLLSQTLASIDTIEVTVQDHGQATLAPMMDRADGVIDWNMTARDISNRVRGFQPFPTAHTTFRGTKMTIWVARSGEAECLDAANGSLISTAGGELIVRTGGSTALAISELQPEGKRRMRSRDFINGSQPKIGEVFGT